MYNQYSHGILPWRNLLEAHHIEGAVLHDYSIDLEDIKFLESQAVATKVVCTRDGVWETLKEKSFKYIFNNIFNK